MATILATVTEDARKYWPKFFGTLQGTPGPTTSAPTVWNPLIKSFKVGEGGWIMPGPTPRTPDPTLRRVDNSIQDIDAIVDSTRATIDQRYSADSRASFSKDLDPGSDFAFVAPSTIQIRCFLDFSEFNDDGFGNNPEIWELGVFSDHPTASGQKLMVAYGTFPKVIKDPSKQVTNYIQIVF